MSRGTIWVVAVVVGLVHSIVFADQPAKEARVAELVKEVGNKGWIVYGARCKNDTWDLYASRPDGSQWRNLTKTPDFEEGAPRFSPDNKQLLFRRFAKGTRIHHDKWGFQGRLVIANADGSHPVVVGEEGEYPWAAWSPDGRKIACLKPKGIEIVDLATKKVVRTLPRKGIYQQLFWSPDGKWFCGTANNLGENWNIARMNVETGELNAVHTFRNCTPDWFPDSRHIIFSNRPADQPGNKGHGWTQLWMADGDGKESRLIYGEDGYHIYGGALSPDGKYVLLTKTREDGGGSERSGGPICVMRTADAPTIGGKSSELRKVHPDTKDGPVLQLRRGWEPCWTYKEIFATQ